MALDIQVRPEADRIKAWELYLEATTGGKYRSLRSIASDLGVSAMTVGRWKEVDKWDEKLKKILAQTAGTAESTSNAIKRRVRRGLLDGLDELQALATDEKVSARDRIAAIKAISEIALKIDAVTAGAFGKEGAAQKPVDFNDDLETQQWPEPTETSSKLEENAESSAATKSPLEASSLPLENQLLSSSPEEALELILADERRADESLTTPDSTSPD